MVGLIGAVDRFDPERENSLSSFAIPTILGELKRHFRTTAWAAHVPRGAREVSLRVQQASRDLLTRSGRTPTVPDLPNTSRLDFETEWRVWRPGEPTRQRRWTLRRGGRPTGSSQSP